MTGRLESKVGTATRPNAYVISSVRIVREIVKKGATKGAA